MLNVYDAENTKADIVDIDAAFSKLTIPNDAAIGEIIASVDEGVFKGGNSV